MWLLKLKWNSNSSHFGGWGCTACGTLVLKLGIEPRSLAVKAQNPNHWTARDFPTLATFQRLTHKATTLVKAWWNISIISENFSALNSSFLFPVLGYNSFPFTCFVFLAYSSLHYPFYLPNLSYSFNSSGEEKSPTLANNRTFNSLTLSKQVLLFITGILQFFIILKVTDTISYSFDAFSINLIKIRITWNLQNP